MVMPPVVQRDFADVVFRRPRLLRSALFAVECTIPVLMLYGIRTAIEDGSIKNDPELLRGIMFGMFSPVICLRFCDLIGLRENTWPNRVLMFAMLYVPIGFLLAKLTGVVE
jgi:hypothetical protein